MEGRDRPFDPATLHHDITAPNSTIASPHPPPLPQVMSVTDVSKPSYARGTSGSSGSTRLLLLKLHDGRTSCKALEHKPCSQLNDTLTPGSKVSVRKE